MEAFQLAHEIGVEGLELDVHLTKDGHIVVAHDETVDRCSNGTGRIVDKTLAELKELDFSYNKKGYSGVRIPTLCELMEFVRKTNMILNIEIKSGIVIYEGIEEKVAKLVEAMGMKQRVIYSSFNHYSLVLIKHLEPTAQIGLLYSEAMVDPHVYAAHLKADAIHPYYPTLMVPGVVEGCRLNGIKINPWTVDNPEHIGWMFKEGTDSVITNRPDIALEVRKSIFGL